VVGKAQLDRVDLPLGGKLVDRTSERPQAAPLQRCAHRGAEVDVGALDALAYSDRRRYNGSRPSARTQR
jgi:hypothetical protein